MAMLSQPAFGPKLSIGLILGGTLLTVWTLVWRFTLGGDTLGPTERFLFTGTLLTGCTLLLVGVFLGQIGRAARKAELPPEEVTRTEAAITKTAAAHPPAVATNVGVPGGVQTPAVTPPPGVAPGAAPPPAAVPVAATPAAY